jgi:hypothetical protein
VSIGRSPDATLAFCGFFSIHNLHQMKQRHIDAYIPDSNMTRICANAAAPRGYAPANIRIRAKLRSPAGQATYARRKAVAKAVFGVLKKTENANFAP